MDHLYRYAEPSTCAVTDSRTELGLATSGGRDPNPFLYLGTMPRPRQTARALLAVAAVARTRFYEQLTAEQLAVIYDPVITVHDDLIRFEAFSSCGSVYVRLDQPVTDGVVTWGTTNIDVNPPMRASLARIGDDNEMLLCIGSDEVSLVTDTGAAVERKVPLPRRWLKGFVEVQLVTQGMEPAIRLPGPAARRLLQQLPTRASRELYHLTSTPSGGRLSMRRTRGSVPIHAPFRLRPLVELLPHLEELIVHAPTPSDEPLRPDDHPPTASAWELRLRDARLVVVVSPELSRGFSGEGNVLIHAALGRREPVDAIGDVLAGQRRLEPGVLARSLHLDDTEVASGLAQLGMLGRLGYDLDAAAYFHRDLPFDRARLEKLQPRLLDARTLVEEGAVTLRGDGSADVRSGALAYRVRPVDGSWRCTCQWFARHAGSRGPCKHVLATRMVGDSDDGARVGDAGAVHGGGPIGGV